MGIDLSGPLPMAFRTKVQNPRVSMEKHQMATIEYLTSMQQCHAIKNEEIS